jgi:hypothetical protein
MRQGVRKRQIIVAGHREDEPDGCRLDGQGTDEHSENDRD